MPKFRVETNQGTFEVEADREPKPEEISAYLEAQKSRQAHDAKVSGLKTELADINRRNSSMAPIERAALGIEALGTTAKDMVVSMGLRGAPVAAGQAIGRRYGGKPGQVIGGMAGGLTGSVLDQSRQILDGKQESYKGGQLIADMLSGGNIARGARINAVSNMALANVESAIDDKKWAGAERTLAAGGTAAIGAAGSKLATGSTVSKKRALEDETYRMAQERGYKLNPIHSNPESKVNAAAVNVAGEAPLNRALVRENQQVTNSIARTELGIDQMKDGPELPISEGLLAYNRELISEPYKKIADLGPEGDSLLKQISRKRFESKGHWRKFGTDGDITAADKGAAADMQASRLEDKLAQFAEKKKAEHLIPAYEEARRMLAKNHVIDSALNKATGDISAQVIGKIYDKGSAKLTDGLEVVARLQNAMPQVMREAAGVGPAGGGHMRNWITGVAGAGGYAAYGPVGATTGVLAAAYGDIPVRNMIQSTPYQRAMAIPRPKSLVNPEGPLATFIRTAPAMEGRNYEPTEGQRRFLDSMLEMAKAEQAGGM